MVGRRGVRQRRKEILARAQLNGRITVGDLTRDWKMSPSSALRRLEKLVDEGFLKRRMEPARGKVRRCVYRPVEDASDQGR